MNDNSTLQRTESERAVLQSPHPQPPPPATAEQRVAGSQPDNPPVVRQVRIYSHSSLFYWWPIWVVGYVLALLTYESGQKYQFGSGESWVHPSSNPGLMFFLVLFLVIVITNFSVRGLASGIAIMGVALLTVLFAYAGWWDEIFRWFGSLEIHLNLGAYFWFSTLMLALWTVTVFGLDRMHFWEVTPGQLTHRSRFGGGSKSYNAQGMSLEKHRDDLFRHWLLGLGSGDLKIRTSGAIREQIDVLNVLFIGSKVQAIQKLISEVPEGSERPASTPPAAT